MLSRHTHVTVVVAREVEHLSVCLELQSLEVKGANPLQADSTNSMSQKRRVCVCNIRFST